MKLNMPKQMCIYKYPLEITDTQEIPMPSGAKLLDVQVQRDACCLWALCDLSQPFVSRKIAVYGTGNSMPNDPGEYVATFQWGGSLVFHVFELG